MAAVGIRITLYTMLGFYIRGGVRYFKLPISSKLSKLAMNTSISQFMWGFSSNPNPILIPQKSHFYFLPHNPRWLIPQFTLLIS
jgi:hypothetical protein